MLAALDSGRTPPRLPLGDDSVDALMGHLDSVRDELPLWEPVSRDVDLPPDPARPAPVLAPTRSWAGRAQQKVFAKG
ncbi:hypothetical protein GCM10010300_12570 [Streptomyces olivaceoviridis]|uniref:hypothetical protein n=1 Tax=Streptomyces olivaceoviridis TaxID=1921 RepID=UPI001676EE32|nr:hypothetical protein GCM10010300_12570 [Streptomyces olivaceoviridis]